MKNYTIFCECKDFGWEITKNTDDVFMSIIANIDLEIGCQILSFFSSIHWSEKRKIFDLCDDVFKMSRKMKKRLRNKQIICYEGVKKAWEVLLKNRQHCSKQKKDIKDIDVEIRNIIKLVVYCQTLYVKPMELEPEETILIQSVREYRDNFTWAVARGRFIYMHNEQLDQSVAKLRAEMEQKFYDEFTITLKDYFDIISSIISRFHEINKQWFNRLRYKYFFESYPLDLSKSLGSLEPLRISVVSLLKKLSLDLEQFESAFQDKDVVEPCIRNPFFKLSDGRFVPINTKYVEDLLWVSLYYKIADCYDNKMDFYNLFGRLYENYVSYLTKETCEFHKSEYQYIPEFSYGKPSKKSPDAMIRIHNATDNIDEVLVIEAKSARLLYGMKKDNFSQDDIVNSYKKVIYDPLSQAEKAIADIIQKGVREEITAEKLFCIVCVSMENIPFKIQIKSAQNNLEFNSMGFKSVRIAICIEEFEMLMQLLSQPQCESIARDIVRYLLHQNDVCNYDEIQSFKNFINRYTIYPRIKNMPGTMDSITKKLGLAYQIDVLPDHEDAFIIVEEVPYLRHING